MNLASPPARDFGPQGNFDPNPQGGQLLEYLAWSVTAAAVAGVMFVGVQMAMQLRYGEMGAGSVHFRGLVLVMIACILCISAGPLVEFVVQPYLLSPP
ncbi:hypothetical protein [Streptomyces niveus]|uniref:hypothetical protein n=1 Tax=Streptomyces niveus TaxID=193462 RepID=UPI0003C58C40|nr:hypothetical protein [Streptomyces niveus]EST26561.1 hypothetical protein M877_18905 [Streptomyces niveus NCIMB 11891]